MYPFNIKIRIIEKKVNIKSINNIDEYIYYLNNRIKNKIKQSPKIDNRKRTISFFQLPFPSNLKNDSWGVDYNVYNFKISVSETDNCYILDCSSNFTLLIISLMFLLLFGYFILNSLIIAGIIVIYSTYIVILYFRKTLHFFNRLV